MPANYLLIFKSISLFISSILKTVTRAEIRIGLSFPCFAYNQTVDNPIPRSSDNSLAL